MPLWSSHTTPKAEQNADDEKVEAPAFFNGYNEVKEIQHSNSSRTAMPTPSASTAVDHSGPHRFHSDALLPAPVHSTAGSSHGRRTKKKSARISGLTVHWARFKKRVGTGTAPSTSSLVGESAADSAHTRRTTEGIAENSDGVVDEVVVDRVWADDIKSTTSPRSEHAATPEKTASQQHNQAGASEPDSMAYDGFWNIWTPLAIIRWRTWPLIMELFSSRFVDEKAEQHYAQEDWFLKKSLALWAALWLICNWVLGTIFIPKNPIVLTDKIFYFGVAPILSLPVVFMVMYDWPRDRPYVYQVFLVFSIWCWAFYQVIYILVCGFYTTHANCQGRDFLPLFYYTTALQTIGVFGLKLNRFPAALGALSFFLFTSISIIPLRSTWGRTMINFFIFQAFLIYVHYMRESSERRLFTLRDQLKIQYKATQKAQINERKAAESKRRLTSYVFHEVRVPLNTALLAVQNMEAAGAVGKDQEIEFNALCGSLSMMSKVLNDVLDFNRMDSGKFESASRPYPLHSVMRSLFVPLQMATHARGLTFEAILDPNIDVITRKAAYEAMGQDQKTIRKHIAENPDVAGIVVGDETRLRQIITNLASNACKFTPSGGKLIIATRLILPNVPEDTDPLDIETAKIPRIEKPEVHPKPRGDKEKDKSSHQGSYIRSQDSGHANGHAHAGGNGTPGLEDLEKGERKPLSENILTEHNKQHATSPLEHIVVRFEVTDTGFGIKARDMAQSKLFSAFNQTEQGRQQGGKGTGLGLALVRQIVKLSGGRLGVRSKEGEGSTFWVEMPLGVGAKTFTRGPPDLPDGSSTSDLEPKHPGPRSQTSQNGTPAAETPGESHPPLGADPSVKEIPRSTDRGGRRGDRNSVKPSLSSEAMRSKAALQGLMEQGGMFEIKLRKPYEGSGSTPPPHVVEDPMSKAALELAQAQVSSSSSTPSPTRPRSSTAKSRDDLPGQPPQAHDFANSVHESERTIQGITESSRHTPVQRPTYVKLPSPKVYSMEEEAPPLPSAELTTSTSTMSSSDRSTSNLKMFDNSFTRGSPSASFSALNIEPGLPVLVVDDDLLTRTLMKRILTRLGCSVTCAENGELALEMILGQRISLGTTPGSDASASGPILETSLPHPSNPERPFHEEGKYAVVFLDNQMPVMSGLKAVENLRDFGRNDFVVGVTGNALLTDQEEYLSAGVNRVLTKPVLERNLRDVLVEADERRKVRLGIKSESPE